jgi:hypothetical protein
MMASYDTNEYKPEEAQNGDIDKHIMGHCRRFQQHKSNRAQRRQKWRKMKKMIKWMHKRLSCFCLQTKQQEKLQELIKKEGLEKEFPQIMQLDEDTVDDDKKEEHSGNPRGACYFVNGRPKCEIINKEQSDNSSAGCTVVDGVVICGVVDEKHGENTSGACNFVSGRVTCGNVDEEQSENPNAG